MDCLEGIEMPLLRYVLLSSAYAVGTLPTKNKKQLDWAEIDDDEDW